MAVKRTESPQDARSGYARPHPSPSLRREREAKYGASALRFSREHGISPWEASGWLIQFRHDEHVEHHRPRSSLMPQWARELALAMIEQAVSDIRAGMLNSAKIRYLGADYRPDPAGAREWMLREDDDALSFVWCAQVLDIPVDAIRKRYVGA